MYKSINNFRNSYNSVSNSNIVPQYPSSAKNYGKENLKKSEIRKSI